VVETDCAEGGAVREDISELRGGKTVKGEGCEVGKVAEEMDEEMDDRVGVAAVVEDGERSDAFGVWVQGFLDSIEGVRGGSST